MALATVTSRWASSPVRAGLTGGQATGAGEHRLPADHHCPPHELQCWDATTACSRCGAAARCPPARSSRASSVRVWWVPDLGDTRPAEDDVVGGQRLRAREAGGAGGGEVVVLVDAVTADPKSRRQLVMAAAQPLGVDAVTSVTALSGRMGPACGHRRGHREHLHRSGAGVCAEPDPAQSQPLPDRDADQRRFSGSRVPRATGRVSPPPAREFHCSSMRAKAWQPRGPGRSAPARPSRSCCLSASR